jgi:hypothetical protein
MTEFPPVGAPCLALTRSIAFLRIKLEVMTHDRPEQKIATPSIFTVDSC